MKKIFISHGHDELSLLKIRTFIKEVLKHDVIVLKEMPDNGLTIVEKLEIYSKDCDFAIILITCDDFKDTNSPRARQNVIHELGFFHGKIGRKKVLLCKEIGVELFSNISGLIYKEFKKEYLEAIFVDIKTAIDNLDASTMETIEPSKKDNTGIVILNGISNVISDYKSDKIYSEWRNKLFNKLFDNISNDQYGIKLLANRIPVFIDEEEKQIEGGQKLLTQNDSDDNVLNPFFKQIEAGARDNHIRLKTLLNDLLVLIQYFNTQEIDAGECIKRIKGLFGK